MMPVTVLMTLMETDTLEVLAHAPDEMVPVDDLVKASAFYALYALTLAGENEVAR